MMIKDNMMKKQDNETTMLGVRLQELESHSNLRRLPSMVHDGREVIVNGRRMLNHSSNDYLGLGTDRKIREMHHRNGLRRFRDR